MVWELSRSLYMDDWAVDKVLGMFNNASTASRDGYPWFGIVFEALVGSLKGG